MHDRGFADGCSRGSARPDAVEASDARSADRLRGDGEMRADPGAAAAGGRHPDLPSIASH